MDPSMLALMVAAVGVMGTLLAPVVSALTTARNKRQEVEMQLLQDAAAQKRQDEKQRFAELRACYIALNTSSRAYQGALRGLSHALELPSNDFDELLVQLAPVREIYREKYAEAQMIVSEGVLPEISRVNGLFAESYGMARRLAERKAGPGDSPADLRRLLDALLVCLRVVRSKMREDLGIHE